MSADDPSVADLLTFASWPDEQQRIARAVARFEIDGEFEERMEEEYDRGLASVREDVRPALDIVNEAGAALSKARDVTQPREQRQADYVRAQNRIDEAARALRDAL